MKVQETHGNIGTFEQRHIGPSSREIKAMLDAVGVESLDELIQKTVPNNIRLEKDLDLPEGISEYGYLRELKKIASSNKVFRSYIGMGYSGTITPSAIQRNIFENPGWYTQYTPYQAEISQGRLEALLNFQTVVSDLTGLEVANASLLDEATAAAEAMLMFHNVANKKRGVEKDRLEILGSIYPQTNKVLETRAAPLGVELDHQEYENWTPKEDTFAILIQLPDLHGSVADVRSYIEQAKAKGIYVIIAADIMSLVLLESPGKWGADAVVGNTQRFGVPMGFGGPHAAYFATKDDFKRQIPGRIIGLSIDRLEKPALRMALQTREQHIKREKATSNICTAQALLAIMAGMYAVYHGAEGLKAIASKIHNQAVQLATELTNMGYSIKHSGFFDTIRISANQDLSAAIKTTAENAKINFRYSSDSIYVALDETVLEGDLSDILQVFKKHASNESTSELDRIEIPQELFRKTEFLTHPVFHSYHSESKLMRYIKRLENKDLSLVHSMIPLGSCTMKLNAATELYPVSWPEFSSMHPFAPESQTKGYQTIFKDLSKWLCEITGFTACSLQPNSGAQGEYAGLLAIRSYHFSRGDHHRDIALIPSSAHGTNPASAVMAGMKVVVVKCDEKGNIDLADLKEKCDQYADNLSSLMVTYPSTHGVFESSIMEICAMIHENGGLVYMDGANMNAQVGLTSPGAIGADVCHLNLHKTFSIPHGGGGPGMGPICVNDKLKDHLPGDVLDGENQTYAVSAAEWGSASILLISYGYIRMLGRKGVRSASEVAILNANYIKHILESDYDVLYTGEHGFAAHELILDLRPFKGVGVSAEDVAKRLIDYGFHAPTLSFPVPGTIMIEPTESEDTEELDRFCQAMLSIKAEIDEIATGSAHAEDNVLINAPHTLAEITADEWHHGYSREKAAFPVQYLREGRKFWPMVSRVNNSHGDRNLICTCPPIESYQEDRQAQD